MRVDYQNVQHTEEFARVTFVGYDPKTGKRRRPMIELDAHDLSQLVNIAKQFRDFQKRLAGKHNSRGDAITQAGVALG